MGSLISKETNYKEDVVLVEGNIPSIPILTPNGRACTIDPRSPSSNVSRTPIEIMKSTLNDPIEDQDTFNINSPRVLDKVLLDPRSPVVEFTRTPIITQVAKLPKLRNKNFDNVLQTETPKQRKPKLLDSTLLQTKFDDPNKRKSFLGYLETNMDFVETDLDDVIHRKSLSNLCIAQADYYTPEKSLATRIDDPRSPSYDCIRTPIVIDKNDVGSETISRSISKEIADHDTSNYYLAIDDEDTVVIPKDNPENHLENVSDVQSIMHDIIDGVFNIEDIQIDLIPRIVATSPKPRKIIQNFDKKIANLIYEDAKPNEIAEDKANLKGVENVKDKAVDKRTPLSDRNCTNKIRSIPKLRVHDKPRKAQYSVTKIPQYKGNRLTKLALKQCENTPPGKNISAWDSEDNTLVI